MQCSWWKCVVTALAVDLCIDIKILDWVLTVLQEVNGSVKLHMTREVVNPEHAFNLTEQRASFLFVLTLILYNARIYQINREIFGQTASYRASKSACDMCLTVSDSYSR